VNTKKSIGIAALAGILVLGLSACSTTEHPTAKVTHAVAKATPTPTPTPDGTSAHPYPQGTVTVTDLGSQWDVTLTNLNTNATATVQAQDQYATLTAGSQYLMGTLTVQVNKNIQTKYVGQTTSVYFSVGPVYVGGDGKVYDSSSDVNSSAALTSNWYSQPDIVDNVGVKVAGDFAFAVPTAAIVGGHFGVENLTSNKIVYFQ